VAVQALENEIELVVTWVCNWHCNYCSVDTHNRPILTMDEVKQKLNSVTPGYIVTLSGGEVGTMKREDIEYIIKELKSKKCKLHINTNGLFIKRYKDLCKHFDNILYHCSEDLELSDNIIIDEELNLDYLLIVTDKNFHKLESFLNKYKDIKFNLVSSTMPFGINGTTLSKINKNKMLAKFHNRMTEESKMRVFKEKDFDAIIYL
jgi:organic radical activating enzyme